MSKRIVMLVLSLVVIASLVLAGCAPETAPPPEEEEEEAAPEEEEEEGPPPVQPEAEVHKWDCQSFMATGEPEWADFQAMFEKIELLSGGQLDITVHPSGALASGWKIPDCVPEGVCDLWHSGLYPLLGVFGPAAYLLASSGLPAGPTALETTAWYYVGDGMELCNEAMADYGYVIGLACDTAELFCHSNVKMETAKDLKGLKFRTYGLWAEIMKDYGASVITLSGDEVYSAAERGVIDAFEFRPPAANWTKGFHEITKYLGVPGIHSPANPHIFLVNKEKWDSLPEDLQTLLKDEISGWALHRLIYGPYDDALAMKNYEEYGTELVTVSDELQQDIARRTKEWCEKTAAEDALFKKVYENQMAFVKAFRKQSQIVQPQYSMYD